MKFKKSALLVACAMVASASALAFAACSGEAETITVDWTVLSAPTNVSVTYGDDSYSSEDDYVTFDAVDGAVEYRVYVYQDGDETAKVTSGTDTTVEMPTPLDAGTYNVSVIAVGDQLTTYNSVGSDVVSYTLDELTQTKLGTPTDLSLDLSEGVIKFTGDANAQSYIVNIYATESDYSFSTSDDPATYFNIPGGDTNIEYTISEDTLSDLTPGYFAFTVQALGDDYYYSDGDTASSTTFWRYGAYVTPEISVQEDYSANLGPVQVSLTGAVVFLSNYEDYFQNTVVTIYVYSDENYTTLVTTGEIEYYSQTMFGMTIVYNYVAFDSLTSGETYYFVAQVEGDDVIYVTSELSDTVSLTLS